MSGHSKWHKVKHQKAINDPKRSKEFSRLSKLIASAAKEGGANPDMNPTLRSAIEEAKKSNMPKDNIQRAINKGAGVGTDGPMELVTLEGYGPGGVAFLINATTDNRNRTIQEVRNIFKKHSGSLGEPGSAAYVFGDDPKNPSFTTPVDESTKRAAASLVSVLEEMDDVDIVYTNFVT